MRAVPRWRVPYLLELLSTPWRPGRTWRNHAGIEYEENEHNEVPKERYTDRKILSCPWHGWDFDIKTGEHSGISKGTHKIPKYDVEVESRRVFIS